MIIGTLKVVSYNRRYLVTNNISCCWTKSARCRKSLSYKSGNNVFEVEHEQDYDNSYMKGQGKKDKNALFNEIITIADNNSRYSNICCHEKNKYIL